MRLFVRLNKRELYGVLGLIASTPLLISCIVSYGALAKADIEKEPPSKNLGFLYYNVDPLALLEQAVVATRFSTAVLDPMTPTRQTFEPLRHVFAETQIFAKTIPTPKAPAIGMFCSVDVTLKPPSKWSGFAQLLTFASVGFIPSYSDSGFIVTYDLYIDGDLKKSYRYEVKRTLLAWLVLLPFVWVNALTPSHGEAVASTAYQFFHDARQDAFF